MFFRRRGLFIGGENHSDGIGGPAYLVLVCRLASVCDVGRFDGRVLDDVRNVPWPIVLELDESVAYLAGCVWM